MKTLIKVRKRVTNSATLPLSIVAETGIINPNIVSNITAIPGI